MSHPLSLLNPAELLEHDEFLRSLARSLVGESAGADDVVQQAYVAALARAPRNEGRLRAWMAGIVRRLAWRWRRSDERRRRHESSAPSVESFPTTEEVLAREEARQRVVAAVLALEEPARTTMLLRYFRELSPAEIAQRMNVPLETVRTRLKRSLERMRVDLDQRYGDRSLWGALLLPVGMKWGGAAAAGASAGVTLHTLASGGIGALAMSSKIKAAIVAALAIAATAAIVQFGFDGEPRTNASRDANPTSALSAPAEANAAPAANADSSQTAAQRSPEPTPTASTVSGPFVVRGRTLDHAGKSLAHLHVKLQRFDGYETDGSPEATAIVESDGDGAFAWPMPLPRGTVTLTANSAENDFVAMAQSALVFAGDPPAPIDLQLYRLDSLIVGRVTEEGDAPLGDARVQSWVAGGVDCDENGEYSLSVASTLDQAWVSVNAPGHVEIYEPVDVRGSSHGKPVTRNFRLRPGVTVVGRVSDESGSPIEGARVQSLRANLGRGTTGPDGRYELSGIDPQNAQFTLDVSHRDFAPQTLNVSPVGSPIVQDFVLSRGARVTGVVFDVDGKPARGAKVWVGHHPYMIGTQRGLAHDDGSFTFAHVPFGSIKVGAEQKGRAMIEKPLEVTAEAASREGVELRFSAGHKLAGKVQDSDGNPIAGASVLTRRNPSDFDISTRSDANGHFELVGVPEGTIQVDAYASGFESATLHGVTLDRDDLVLVMPGAGGLAGTVVDAQTGAPLDRFRIRFVEAQLNPGDAPGTNYEATWQDPGRVFTNTNGIWDTRGESLPMNSIFGIEASADGYAPSYALHVKATAAVDPGALVLRLGRGAQVTGSVVDENGVAVAGASVRLFMSKRPPRGWNSASTGDPRWSVRTGDTGTFTIEGVSGGEACLLVSGAGFPSTEDGPFEVPTSGNTPPRRIRLERGGTIDGLVLDSDGRPRANKTVMLFDMRDAGTGLPPTNATTDLDGAFHFTGVRPGVLQVSLVDSRSFQSVNEMSARVTVIGGAVATLRLQPQGDAQVQGRVVGDLEKLECIRVECRWMGPLDATGAAADERDADGVLKDRGAFAVDGRFDFKALPAGRWTISADGREANQSGYWFGRAEVRVEAGGTAEATVTLEKR